MSSSGDARFHRAHHIQVKTRKHRQGLCGHISLPTVRSTKDTLETGALPPPPTVDTTLFPTAKASGGVTASGGGWSTPVSEHRR